MIEYKIFSDAQRVANFLNSEEGKDVKIVSISESVYVDPDFRQRRHNYTVFYEKINL